MAQPINKFKLGLFVIAALILMLAAIISLALSDRFANVVECETYFDSTIQGVDRGAQVRLRGIRVGQVTQVALASSAYPDAGQLIMIRFTIDPVVFYEGGSVNKAAAKIKAEVEQGLRARLAMMGVTGSSFLELDYVLPEHERYIIKPAWEPQGVYIPSTPGIISEIGQSLSRITQSLENVDFVGLSKNAESMSHSLDQALSQFTMFMTEATETVKEVRIATQSINQLVQHIDTTLTEFGDGKQLVGEASTTLRQMNSLLKRTEQALVAPQGDLAAILANMRLASENFNEVTRLARDYPSFILLGEQPPKVKYDEPKKQTKKKK